jgi:hypothetical protein
MDKREEETGTPSLPDLYGEGGREEDMEGVTEQLLDDTDGSQTESPSRGAPARGTEPTRTAEQPKERSVITNMVKGKVSEKNIRTGTESEIDIRLKNAHLYSGSDDEVFGSVSSGTYPPPAGSGNVLGSGGASNTDLHLQAAASNFPPAYGVLRAAKNKALAAGRLGDAYGYGRATFSRVGYGGTGMVAEGDSRGYRAQNYHSAEKGLNI